MSSTLYDQIERQAAEIERLKREFNRAESAYMSDVREAKCERDKARRDENLRANDVFRGIVAENDRLKSRVAELTESVDLLDEQGRKMKTERDEARAELTHYVTLLRESAPDIDKALEGSKPPDLKDHNAWTIYAFIAALAGFRKMEEARTQERDAALLEVAALKLALGASRSAFADGEAHERRKRDVTIERLQGEIDAARAEIERRADPFPLGRGPETCGTHCARCGEKIHLVRPTTGPDREERLENHCCPGGAS